VGENMKISNKTYIIILAYITLAFNSFATEINTERGIKLTNIIKGSRFSLVIGNSNYQHISPLKNPFNDAKDITEALKKSGFEVITLLNADYKKMREGIQLFSDKINNGGVALFYYAGHALQVKGRNYLVPVNAQIKREYQLTTQTLDVNEVINALEYAQTRINIIILDSCRDNPFRSFSRSIDRGLARIDAGRGSIIIYSTAPGKTANDGAGRNGVFTESLLNYISEPIELSNLLRKVRKEVIDNTNGFQVPWESSSLTGEFYFVSPQKEDKKKDKIIEKIYVDDLSNIESLSSHFKSTWKEALILAGEGSEQSLNKSLAKLSELIDEATENDVIFEKLVKMIKVVTTDRDQIMNKRKERELAEEERLRKLAEEQARIAEEKRRKAEEDAITAKKRLAEIERIKAQKEMRQIQAEKEAKVSALLKKIELYLNIGDIDSASINYRKAYNLMPEYSGLKKYSNEFSVLLGGSDTTEIEKLVVDYYSKNGEWAGVFVIDHIEKLKIKNVSSNEKEVHVRYKYRPIPGNKKGRKDSGYDQRIFILKKNVGKYSIVRMLGYQSARF